MFGGMVGLSVAGVGHSMGALECLGVRGWPIHLGVGG